MSSNDAAMLSKQKELLMERLADFEATNRTLRKMLRDRHEREAAGLRLTEQRDLLLKKLSETEDLYQRLRTEILDKERQLVDYRLQLDAQRVNIYPRTLLVPVCSCFVNVVLLKKKSTEHCTCGIFGIAG